MLLRAFELGACAAAPLPAACTVVGRCSLKFIFSPDATLPDVTVEVLGLIAVLEKNLRVGIANPKEKVKLRLYFKVSSADLLLKLGTHFYL